MEQEAKGIRYQTEHYPTVQGLMGYVNEQSLKTEHRKQSRKKAPGIDGVGKAEYDVSAEENIQRLVERMRKFQYKPLPVRRTYIPKANGKLRPLGIPAYEDKLVQGVMSGLLSEVYEGRFLNCSYGFRPGRSAHDVVEYINQTIMSHKIDYVLEADIKGFFDNVNHDRLGFHQLIKVCIEGVLCDVGVDLHLRVFVSLPNDPPFPLLQICGSGFADIV